MMFYVLSVALILAGCLVFYKLLLQNETFFPLNRYVLLICLALSFSLPLIPVPAQWSFRKANVEAPIIINEPTAPAVDVPQQQPTVQAKATTNTESKPESSFFKDVSILKVLLWAYWLGVIVFAVNFVFQLCVLLFRAYSRPVIIDGRFRIVELSGNQAPCSFGSSIFINPEKYDWDTYNQIILHEKIHIQQGHSYDILIAELALIFQWFNPFAWMYRKAMEDNLEFLTDNELLANSDIEPASYQMSLVKVSAPHFPASLTTNYNQSILKKRLVMMNAKKSNVNSTWKYLFIVPLLLVFIAFLNEPMAYAKNEAKAKNNEKFQLMDNEGTWFASIKGDKVHIRFESDEDGKSNSNTTFPLEDFKNLPRGNEGTFSLTREAGTMNFTGKFDNNTGMGSYKFNPNAEFTSLLTKEGITGYKEKDNLVFFMINAKKSFISGIKALGYDRISKDNLIPLIALNVTPEYIKSIKTAGLPDVTLDQLIPLKALDVDANFITGIKQSGYSKITADKMVTFKAQGIDGEYLKSVKMANDESRDANHIETGTVQKIRSAEKPAKKSANNDDDEDPAFGNLIAKKVLNVTPAYAKGFTDKGLKVNDEDLIGMKSLGITPEFFESFKAAGLDNITANDLKALKAVGATASDFTEYKKLGLKINDNDLIGMKSMGITPAFFESFKAAGLDNVTAGDLKALKSVGATANDFAEFKKLGFKDMDIHNLIAAKTTGTSPVFVASMKKIGRAHV